MKIARIWEKFTCGVWAKYTLMDKALCAASKNASRNIDYSNLPLWVKIRLKFWHYGMFIFWTKELPLKFKQWKFYKRTGIKL